MAIALVKQTAAIYGDNTTSANGSFSGAPGAGALITATAGIWRDGGGTTLSCSDGTAYTVDVQSAVSGNSRSYIFSRANVSSGSALTLQFTAGGANSYFTAFGAEWSGAATSSVLRDSGSSSAGGGSGSVQTSGSDALTGDLVLACLSSGDGASDYGITTPATGYSDIGIENDGGSHHIHGSFYKLATGDGLQSAAWSGHVSQPWTAAIAVYAAGDGGGDPGGGNVIGRSPFGSPIFTSRVIR